mgnify:FL=1
MFIKFRFKFMKIYQASYLVSFLHFSSDYVLGELLFILEVQESHLLGFLDHCRLLTEDESHELGTDLLVTCGGLGDNEVQENDASDDDDQQPHEPVDDVLGVIKQNGGIESKVTHGHSEGREQISHEETHIGVLGAGVLIGVGELVLELSWNVLVSDTKDTQQQGEQDDQNV